MRRKYKKKTNRYFLILICIFIIMFIYSTINIIIWFKNNKDNKQILDEISDAVIIEDDNKSNLKYKIDFNVLKAKNPDTVAWLKVEETKIEYPLVQTTNNDYYMSHNFDKTYNEAGWIFVDYKNNINEENKNIVIYGHNRKDGSMFGSLKNVLNPEWYNNEKNIKIIFITEDNHYIYEIFSIYKIKKEDYYIKTNFIGNEFSDFIKIIKSRSIKDFNIQLTTEDDILTLSTCAGNNKYRIVIHAVKIK